MRYADIKQPSRLRLLCSLCACAATDAAHLDARGMGGRGDKAPDDADDATPLCRTCHDAEHKRGELVMKRHDSGQLWFTAKGRTARRLGSKEGQWRAALYEGKTFDDPIAPPDEDAPDITEPLALCEAQVVGFLAHEGEEWRKSAEAVALALDLFLATYPKREARERHKEWRQSFTDSTGQPVPLDASESSRMMTVVKHLPESAGRSLPKSKQYLVARAVKERVCPLDDALNAAQALSVSDLIAEWWPKADEVEPERVACPLGLACRHIKEA